MKNLKVSLVLFALVLSPLSAFAAVPWSGSPGASVIDEGSTSLYEADTATLGFKAGASTGTIVGRINLTDTTATGYPGWTTIEIRGYDPGASSDVRAKLMRISGGTISNVATCATADDAMVQNVTCSIPQVDFNSGYIYVVQLEVIRTSTSVSPFISGVKIY